MISSSRDSWRTTKRPSASDRVWDPLEFRFREERFPRVRRGRRGQSSRASFFPLFVFVFLAIVLSGNLPVAASVPAETADSVGHIQSILFPRRGFPLAADASGLTHDVNREFERERVEYDLERSFPAEDVIEFYRREFRAAGLVPDPEAGYPMGRWESFDGTRQAWVEWTGGPARYVATWVDPRRSVRTLLILRYDQTEGDPARRNRLHVHLSHQKMFTVCDILPWR